MDSLCTNQEIRYGADMIKSLYMLDNLTKKSKLVKISNCKDKLQDIFWSWFAFNFVAVGI